MAPDAYAWWYLDALSDDGRHALTVIAFIGSVFSPYYAAARRRGPTDPRQHVAINVALYGDGVRRWTMTERGARQLQCGPEHLSIGPSALQWRDGALELTLDEVAAPWPQRVRGQLRLVPRCRNDEVLQLDAAGAHRWQPIAPRARVTLALQEPALRWSGEGYLDANWGDAPLEQAFDHWHWSRTPLGQGACLARYELQARDGSQRRLALHFGRDGALSPVEAADPPALLSLPRSRWGLDRQTRGPARLLSTLEDGPFYARSLLATQWQGQARQTMHESLSLLRFRQRWVQALLPFRMPRRAPG
ncbi:carotenoid 1,2-hydratase [Aquabacterium sp.]|uniref:carotenoid 1,2-hydratase n=1 Tax=Aquabacterium sp. TaxID=1872578 RepID=UPI0037852C5B